VGRRPAQRVCHLLDASGHRLCTEEESASECIVGLFSTARPHSVLYVRPLGPRGVADAP